MCFKRIVQTTTINTCINLHSPICCAPKFLFLKKQTNKRDIHAVKALLGVENKAALRLRLFFFFLSLVLTYRERKEREHFESICHTCMSFQKKGNILRFVKAGGATRAPTLQKLHWRPFDVP